MIEQLTESAQQGAFLQTYLDERAQNAFSGNRLADLGRHVAQMPRKEQILVHILRDLIRENDAESLDAVAKAIVADGLPDDPDLLFVLARAHEHLQQFTSGLNCLEKAIAIQSDNAMYRNNAGVFYDKLGRASEAKEAFALAMKFDPESALYAINYGNICANSFDDVKEALRAYHLAFALDPAQPESLMRAALALLRSGERDKAIDKLRLLLRVHPGHIEAVFAKIAFMLSEAYESTDAMLRLRESLERQLDTVHEEVSKIVARPEYRQAGMPEEGWRTLFLLAYQGQNDKAIMQRYSHELSRALQPFFDNEITRSRRDVARSTARRKIRIGFCTEFFYHHSVWKIPLHGIYTHIDRSRFEVHSFHMGGTVDAWTDDVRKLSDSYVRCTSIASMVERLNRAELDVLVFPELGMNSQTFVLSQMRFCQVQCQMLGHPITSGSQNVDYVLSSDLMEPEYGQDHYTEKLVRLPGLGVTYTYRYEKIVGSKTGFGLGEDDVVFFSPQSVFKYLPENDDLFARIALKVDKAKFVFISPGDRQGSLRVFRKRLSDAFAQHGLDADDHVVFIGPQGKERFMRACNMADLFIDNPSWSGHNTILDALHSHTRVVAMRGDMMRKSHGSAILDHLGLNEYIAESKDAFVEKCVQVVTNHEDKVRFESLIEERLLRFGDIAPVKAMEAFLFDAIASSHADVEADCNA